MRNYYVHGIHIFTLDTCSIGYIGNLRRLEETNWTFILGHKSGNGLDGLSRFLPFLRIQGFSYIWNRDH